MSFDRVEAQQEARRQYIEELKSTYMVRAAKMGGRKIEFFKHNQSVKNELAKTLAVSAIVGMGTGGTIGLCVGGLCGTPGGPVGMLMGGGIGLSVGMVIGLGIGSGIATYNIYPKYKEWCNTSDGKEFASKISYFLSEDKLMEHLICPITQMPILDGVRTPSGQLYEKTFIQKWVRDHGTDPLTRKKLTLESLKQDPTATAECARNTVKFLKKNRNLTNDSCPKLIEGYDKMIEDIENNCISMYNRKLLTLQRLFQNKKITFDAMKEGIDKLQKEYLDL